MNSLGIYFGPKFIDVVVTNGRKLINNIQIPLVTISAGELEEKVSVASRPDEIVTLFRDAFRRGKIEAKDATLCLSGKDLVIRTFEMPMLSRAELASAVNFEARKYMPFKIEDLVTGYQALPDKTKRNNLVFFMGIKKETLSAYLSMFKQLDIKLNSIEYSGFSVLRVLKMADSRIKGTAAMLCIDHQGEDEVNFTVLDNDFPLFSRDYTVFGGLGAAEKVEEIGEQDVALEKLNSEIRVSLDYYRRKFPGRDIQKMFLICGKDYQSQLERFFVEIGLTVKTVDVANLVKGPIVYSSGFTKAYSASLLKTIKIGIKIDLLAVVPEKIAAKKVSTADVMLLFTGLKLNSKIIALALLICLGGWGLGVSIIQPARKELIDITGARLKVSGVASEAGYEELNTMNSAYLKKIEDMDNLIKKQPYLTKPLDVIPRAITEGLWLTRFSFSQKQGLKELTIEGAVYLDNAEEENLSARQFFNNLKEDRNFAGFFKSVNLASVERKEALGKKILTNFLITCKD